ncbi:MAG: nucleotidyltransferase family protein, partial [Bacteroidales bacterium]|nr:nucleotidyltransferase family protein [Bacteroidales bacterium]
VSNRESSRKFFFDNEMKLVGWKNFKTNKQIMVSQETALQELAFSGIHIISPSIFKLIKQKGSFSIVDAYLDLCKNHTILGFDTTGSYLLDVGKVESLAEASRFLGQG